MKNKSLCKTKKCPKTGGNKSNDTGDKSNDTGDNSCTDPGCETSSKTTKQSEKSVLLKKKEVKVVETNKT